MIATDETTQRQSLSLDFDLPHPPAKVWRALTDPALLAEWLMPVIGFELRPGASFTFRTQAPPQSGWDGTVDCRLVAAEPYRTLSYSWCVPFMETVVTFTLTPNETGTRLSLVQSGFALDQKRELGGARHGWTSMAGRLSDLLARIA
jgi:uncharacterized protein YndB with AHSA1/START domain